MLCISKIQKNLYIHGDRREEGKFGAEEILHKSGGLA